MGKRIIKHEKNHTVIFTKIFLVWLTCQMEIIHMTIDTTQIKIVKPQE